MLNLYIDIMDKIGELFSTKVTLFVNGFIISGSLIHPIAYFRGTAEDFESNKGDQASMELSKFLCEVINESIETIEEMTDHTCQEPDEREIIYLKEFKVWNYASSLVYDNVFWLCASKQLMVLSGRIIRLHKNKS